MAFDVKDMTYDKQRRMLRGIFRAVAGDPYQLRVCLPDGFKVNRAELIDDLQVAMKTEENLLTIDYKSSTGKDVEWKIF